MDKTIVYNNILDFIYSLHTTYVRSIMIIPDSIVFYHVVSDVCGVGVGSGGTGGRSTPAPIPPLTSMLPDTDPVTTDASQP